MFKTRLQAFLLATTLCFSLLGCGSNQTTIEKPLNQQSEVTESVSSSQEISQKAQTPPVEPTSKTDITKVSNATGSLKVHFIDVGQADSIFIELPTQPKESMLIDAGNNADGDLVVNYIKNLGYSTVNYVIGTHPHEDHIGGLDNVIKAFDIGKIYMPKISESDMPTTKTYEDVLNAIQSKQLKISTAKTGVNIVDINNLKANIISPNGTNYGNLNNYSAVIKLTYGSNSFLFTGDMETDVEQNLTDDVSANVLKIGHHGSDTSTSASFLSKVSPQYAVVSVGKDNKYGHPNQATIANLNNAKIQVFRTDVDGTIIATSDGSKITFDKKASPVKEQAPPSKSSSKKTNATISKPTPKSATVHTEKKEQIVYITKTGKKYHMDGCQYLKKSQIAISLSDAKGEGYSACSRCNPPQ